MHLVVTIKNGRQRRQYTHMKNKRRYSKGNMASQAHRTWEETQEWSFRHVDLWMRETLYAHLKQWLEDRNRLASSSSILVWTNRTTRTGGSTRYPMLQWTWSLSRLSGHVVHLHHTCVWSKVPRPPCRPVFRTILGTRSCKALSRAMSGTDEPAPTARKVLYGSSLVSSENVPFRAVAWVTATDNNFSFNLESQFEETWTHLTLRKAFFGCAHSWVWSCIHRNHHHQMKHMDVNRDENSFYVCLETKTPLLATASADLSVVFCVSTKSNGQLYVCRTV